jgi:subtilisin family serine protease
MSSESEAYLKRRARFESFEDRLALSIQTFASPLVGPFAAPLAAWTADAARDSSAVCLPHSPRDLDWPTHSPALPGTMQSASQSETHNVAAMGGPYSGPNLSAADLVWSKDARDLRAEFGLTGQMQTVAIIDSGIAFDHRALGGGWGPGTRVVGGWDFAENDPLPYDDAPAGFHGTHVAGIIGGNYGSFQGLAPEVDLVALRVMDDAGNGQFSWVAQALEWVHVHRNDFAHPITTVNVSLGTAWERGQPPEMSRIDAALAQLHADGIFVAAAAGNNFSRANSGNLNYPAANPNVLPVASVGMDGRISDFSQRSDRVLAAPGESLLSSVPDFVLGSDGIPDDFVTATGTSMSAPYVSGAAVLIREALVRTGRSDIDHDLIVELMRRNADAVPDPVTNASYQRLNIVRTIESIYASAVRNLDTITQTSLSLSDAGSGETWFRLRAGRTGRLSAEILYAAPAAQLTLELRDISGNRIDARSGLDARNARLDAQVVSGQTYLLRVAGAGVGATLRLTNLITDTATRVDVDGTAGDDQFVLDGSGDTRLTVNGVAYSFQGMRQIYLNAGLGADTLIVAGSGNRDDVSMRPGSLSWQAASFSLQATGFESVQANGAGGADSVQLYGSRFDDRYESAGRVVRMTAPDLNWMLTGFDDIRVDASQGGSDTAVLFDSPGDDLLIMEPEYTSLQNAGGRQYVGGFELVRASSSGGNDLVRMYDSAGNDTAIVRSTTAIVMGAGFRNDATNFGTIEIYLRAGGSDQARLQGTAGDDRLDAYPDRARLQSAARQVLVVGAEDLIVEAAQGGYDRAFLLGSPRADRLVMEPSYSEFSGDGFRYYVSGFGRVAAYGEGGGDEARFYDSMGNDELIASPRSSRLVGPQLDNSAIGFATVFAYARAGGYDAVTLRDSAGDDQFSANGQTRVVSLSGPGYAVQASEFENVTAIASAGHDTAILTGSSGDDTFIAEPDYASMRSSNYYHFARGFQQVTGSAASGGTDTARLYDGAGNDMLRAQPLLVSLAGSGYRNSAAGFRHISVYGRAGGENLAVLDMLRSGDQFAGEKNQARLRRTNEVLTLCDFDQIVAKVLDPDLFQPELKSVDYLFREIGAG